MYKKDFLLRARKKHGDRYNYDLLPVKFRAVDNISITCYKHGVYKQQAYTHLAGGKCRQCSDEDKILTTQHFIDKSNKIHNYKYDYSKSEYKGHLVDIIITCKKHGDFIQKPKTHYNGNGCYHCGLEKLSYLNRMKYDNFLSKANEIHKNKFTYPNLNYKNGDCEIDIICPTHGLYKQRANVHILGYGCKKCSTISRGENSIRSFLTENKIKFEEQYSIEGYKKFKYDFYLPDYNLLIEYDGRQHFKKSSWGGEVELNNIIQRDKTKNKIAKNNNYKLLRISYKEFNQIGDKIMNEIKKDINKGINVAILFCDGAASPNPGHAGSGIHGYIYNTDSIDKKSGEKPTGYTITDRGYIENNIFPRSQTKTVIPTHYVDIVYGYKDPQTNNYGEVMAIISALDDIGNNNDIPINKINIKADSTYALSILQKAINNLSYDHIDKNIVLYELMFKIVEDLKIKGIEITYDKVIAHSTDLGNNIADMLAVYGKQKSATFNIDKDIRIIDAKKYWTGKQDLNPLLDFKQIFFAKHLMINTTNDIIYSVMRYKTDVEPGNKTHEATFGLVVLKEDVNEIKDVIDVYHTNVGSRSQIATIDLQELYRRDNLTYYNFIGKESYSFNRKNNSVLSIYKKPLVYNISPTGLATLAMEKILSMYNNVSMYRDNTLANKFRHVIDISNLIYDTENPKYPTKLDNGTNELIVNYKLNDKDIKIKLDLTTDTLSRNQFKRIEGKKPKVSLVLNMISEKYIEYFTIVETNADEIGIYFSLYSNRIII